MSPINVEVLISLMNTFVNALVITYAMPRFTLGLMSLILWIICDQISSMMSARSRATIRAKLLGLENTEYQALLYSFLIFNILLNVNITLSVSPENKLDLLAPLSTSRPSPLEILFSNSGTLVGPEHCIKWLSLSFSIHLNATIPSLFPCKIPAWLAPVWEDKSVSHLLRL